jgi:uncharacterized protein with gpF-like domain
VIVTPRPKTLDPVRPNAGITRTYAKRLEKLIEEMHRSILYWLRAAYRRQPPEIHRLNQRMASDASPARALVREMGRLRRYWLSRFDILSKNLAEYFATQVAQRSDAQLMTILKRGGFTVAFTRTRAVNDVIQAVVAENVSLIKSIPQQHLQAVEGAVMRSVQRGRDLKSLTDELEQRFKVTHKRAKFISIDQNNKATAMLQRTRQVELGIKEAVWVHSGGGKVPRPTHLKAGRDKVLYDIVTGWYDPAEQKYVLPGELVNCRCVARPVVPGLS